RVPPGATRSSIAARAGFGSGMWWMIVLVITASHRASPRAVGASTAPDVALGLLLRHNIRTLPVVDDDGRLAGIVGLRELATGSETLGAALAPARTASPDQAAMTLIPLLTDGRAHAVVVVDGERRVLGLVTQTDLLAALARSLGAPAVAA
ncbi:MAG: CBS domain-containing protein, partial [Rhizobiales bacterium]|nr:CBS domain-containing protein [Hyphomicrobiales bacterium]